MSLYYYRTSWLPERSCPLVSSPGSISKPGSIYSFAFNSPRRLGTPVALVLSFKALQSGRRLLTQAVTTTRTKSVLKATRTKSVLKATRTKSVLKATQTCARNAAEAKRIQKYKLRCYKFIQINDHPHNPARVTRPQSATGTPAQPRTRNPPTICNRNTRTTPYR